ncbi:hydroxymethylbilane synthase [Kitasatospora sp. NBC_01287]|uniref:hydroxymethylbilane synthase n=1 Tax=Kitasatospora sp. NBC_01287 TaxID=2903573 RepID=UPI00224EEC6B|nr:hydroxymethylbilane synthase [Kitasatospora sp. NBC_01287]MCX4746166.1 hydroxymethylbilane synthase [Kitasatospora sp. NBC_01287]
MPSTRRTIRIGARASAMSLAQVARVRAGLAALHPDVATELVPFVAAGDREPGEQAELHDKGAFTGDIEDTLLSGGCDLAVHCMKDVAGDPLVSPGTVFAAYPKRADIRDALIHPGGLTLDQLLPGTRVATSAVRRVAQLTRSHPHLDLVPIRGTANLRLAALDAGEVDTLVLAASGLERIGEQHRISEILTVEQMCPPLGAAVLGLQCREDDTDLIALLAPLGDRTTTREITAERALLNVLRGHCNSPIAGFARSFEDGHLGLRAMVFSPDGVTVLEARQSAGRLSPEALGKAVGAALIRDGARDLIDSIAR